MLYQEIVKSALSRVDDKYSKRQDSPIFNGVAPSCYEIAKTYELMEEHLRQSFALTASGKYLDYIAEEVGLTRFKATHTIKKAIFKDEDGKPLPIPNGTRFGKDEFTFTVIEKIEIGTYKIECEQAGSISNEIFGKLLPIDNIKVAKAEIVENIYLGEDEEKDEELRTRYLQKVREPATSGNIYHYRRWAYEVEGVGVSKVFPLWQGPGTVKIIILNREMEEADKGLIEKVQKHIDTIRPIGATVTVDTARIKDVKVSARIVTNENPDLEKIQKDFIKMAQKDLSNRIKKYFSIISIENYYVSIAHIGASLLETKDVLDYEELKLNDIKDNITLDKYEIPKITKATFEVI